MKKMLKKKSKGFTLVELLIVIIIIGILAGMMMLSTGGATAKAEATKIVADLRNMKAAAVMVYADSGKWPTELKSLDKYLDQDVSEDHYDLDTANGFIQYKVASVDEDIRTALKKLADSGVPLYNTTSTSADNKYSGGTAGVFIPFK